MKATINMLQVGLVRLEWMLALKPNGDLESAIEHINEALGHLQMYWRILKHPCPPTVVKIDEGDAYGDGG